MTQVSIQYTYITTHKNIFDQAYYYYLNKVIYPLEAKLTILNNNDNDNEPKNLTLKAKICGELEAYIYLDEDYNYISMKKNSDKVFKEEYIKVFKLSKESFERLSKDYSKLSFQELQEYINFEKTPWIELSIFDENDQLICILQNYYFMNIEDILKLKGDFFQKMLIEPIKKY